MWPTTLMAVGSAREDNRSNLAPNVVRIMPMNAKGEYEDSSDTAARRVLIKVRNEGALPWEDAYMH